MDDEARALGEIVRRRRDELGLSQRALAPRAGLSRRHLHDIEHANPSIRFATLFNLAHALDMTATELVEAIEQPREGRRPHPSVTSVIDDDRLTVFTGRAIRRRRQQLGLSVEQLGAGSRIGGSHVAEIERGRRAPRLLTLFRLADALDMDATELVQRIEIALLVAEHTEDR